MYKNHKNIFYIQSENSDEVAFLVSKEMEAFSVEDNPFLSGMTYNTITEPLYHSSQQ